MGNNDKMDVDGEGNGENNKEEVQHTGIKFRNYAPYDNSLKKLRMKKPSVPPVVDEINNKLKDAEKNADKVSVLALAPKKPNFDLKRDADKKLKKLEKKTNQAIYEILRDKLEAEQNVDLAAAVDVGAKHMGY